MKLHPFTNIDPDNYSAQDNMKHLYFKDYKALRDVSFETDSEPLTQKVIASVGFIMLFLLILFI
jgi:hypothetical protein